MNNQFHDPSIHLLAQPSGVVIPHPASQAHAESDNEIEPQDEGEKSLSVLINLASQIDSRAVLQAVGPKLFDHFTVWDLMLAKAKMQVNQGSLTTLVNDTALVLCELKIMIENCLKPIRVGKVAVKKKSHECIEFDDMMTLAMGLETNLWLKRDTDDINYSHSFFSSDSLFPSVIDNEALGKPVIKTEIEEEVDEDEEEDEDEDEKQQGEEEDEEYKEDQERKDEETNDDTDAEVKPKKEKKQKKPRAQMKRKARKKIRVVTASPAKKRRRVSSTDGSQERRKGDFSCPKCGKTYLNFTAWYKHMEKTCASKASLRIKIRTVGDQFFCAYEHCETPKKPFATRDDVHDHWALKHVDEDQKIVPCFMCEQKFATIGAKKLHMRMAHVQSNPLVKKKKKPTKVEVVDDDESKGSKEKHLCLKCGQSMNKESGRKHEEKCNGMYVRRPEYKKVNDEYFCTVAGCNLGYGFNSMYGLRKHFHGKHTREEEKFFACDYCDEKFSFRTTRNKHITEKHMKNHVCDICGKGFGGRSKMLQHRFLHTGEKPYACTKCDYRAAKKSNLEAHMESKHSIFQQKNFICAICNKQFVTMGRVRRHMAEIHADGIDDDGNIEKRRKRRSRALPPPITQEKEQRVVLPVSQVQEDVQHVQVQEGEQVNEQDAAVQYLQHELGPGNETVITVRPLY